MRPGTVELRGVILTLRLEQTSQRNLRIHLEAHAADVVCQRRGAGELRLRLRVGTLREQSLAAPSPRDRFDLAQAVQMLRVTVTLVVPSDRLSSCFVWPFFGSGELGRGRQDSKDEDTRCLRV